MKGKLHKDHFQPALPFPRAKRGRKPKPPGEALDYVITFRVNEEEYTNYREIRRTLGSPTINEKLRRVLR